MILISIGMGGSVSFSIAFIALRSPHSQCAAQLSGMPQSTVYLLATLGSMLIGLLFDAI